jgi:hypothetical protein
MHLVVAALSGEVPLTHQWWDRGGIVVIIQLVQDTGLALASPQRQSPSGLESWEWGLRGQGQR